MLNGALPNLRKKYTAAERSIFLPIISSKDAAEIVRLLSALDNTQLERYEEYEKDVESIQKSRDFHAQQAAASQEQAEQAQAKGDAYMSQYEMYKAKGQQLRNKLQKLEQEEAELMRQQEEDKNSKKKKQCVIS